MEKKIEQMVMFIDRKVMEMERELDANADSEYFSYFNELCKTEKTRIDKQFSAQERRLVKNNVLSAAFTKNKARLEHAKMKHQVVDDAFDAATENIKRDIKKKSGFYSDVLKNLAVQSLTVLVAPRVLFRVVKTDLDKMRQLADQVKKEYFKVSQMQVNIRIDVERFLPESEIGGVVVYSTQGDRKVVNTIKYRISLTRERMIPVIRYLLYGANASRYFYD